MSQKDEVSRIDFQALAGLNSVAAQAVPTLQLADGGAVFAGDFAQVVAPAHFIDHVVGCALARMDRQALADLDACAAEVVPGA